MGPLFERYFLVLSGRTTGVTCGVVASPFTPTGGTTLGWPLDLPADEPPADEKGGEADESERNCTGRLNNGRHAPCAVAF
jgi:hypothetical protein